MSQIIRKFMDDVMTERMARHRNPYDLLVIYDRFRAGFLRTDRQSLAPKPSRLDIYERRPRIQKLWEEAEDFDQAPMRPTLRPVQDEWVEGWTLYEEEKVKAPCWCCCPGSGAALDPMLCDDECIMCPECGVLFDRGRRHDRAQTVYAHAPGRAPYFHPTSPGMPHDKPTMEERVYV